MVPALGCGSREVQGRETGLWQPGGEGLLSPPRYGAVRGSRDSLLNLTEAWRACVLSEGQATALEVHRQEEAIIMPYYLK